MNKYGEIIHGHYGEYKTYHYEKDLTPVESKYFLKNTDRGSNDYENQILILGDAQPNGYIWSSYYAEQKTTGVSMGYQHTIYTEYGLKVLHEIKDLIFFPFLEERECMKYLSGQKTFDALTRRMQMNSKGLPKNQMEVPVSKELLKSLVCYCVAKKQELASSFLYLLVPAEVERYQEYCQSVIWQILEAIPFGLRRNLRIATNAADEQEKNFDILFRRVSDTEIPNSLCLEDRSDYAFLNEIYISEELKTLLNRCVDDRAYLEQCNQIMLNSYDDKELLTGREYIARFRQELSGEARDMEEINYDWVNIENILELLKKICNRTEQERRQVLDEMCTSISAFFQNYQELDYDKVSSVYHAFLDGLNEKEKEWYIEKRGLKERFEDCLFKALSDGMSTEKSSFAICQALDVAAAEIDNFNQKIHWGECIGIIIKRLIEEKTFSETEELEIFNKLWNVYGNTEEVLEKLRELFRKGLSNDNEKEIREKIDSLEAYFLHFKTPCLLYGDMYKLQQSVRKKIVETWPLSKKSVAAFLSAVIAVEGNIEKLCKNDKGAIRFYRQECELFFRSNNGIVLKQFSNPSEIYGQLLLYHNVFEQQFITLYYIPMKKQRFFKRNSKRTKKCSVEAVQKCLRRIISIRSHIIAIEELWEGLKKEEKDCMDFLVPNIFEVDMVREEKARKKHANRRIIRLVLGSIAGAALIPTLLLAVYGKGLFSSGNEINMLKVNKEYVEKINSQAERETKTIKIIRIQPWRQNHKKRELCESDKNYLAKISQAYSLWINEDFVSACDKFGALSMKQLASDVLVSKDKREIIFQYLALEAFQRLNEDKQIKADVFKAVVIYDISAAPDFDEVLKSRFPVLLVTYSEGEGSKSAIYCYEEKGRRYLSYTDLYGCEMGPDEQERRLQELAEKFKAREKELIVRTVKKENINAALEQMNNR